MKDSPKIIHYVFDGIKISRYDIDKNTYLYYGDCNNSRYIMMEASMKIDWQFDDFLQAGLIFHNNGKVEVINRGGGKFNVLKQRSDIYIMEYESPEYSRLMAKYTFPNDFNNFCYIDDNLQFEFEENKKFKSKVTIATSLQKDKKTCP